MLHSLELDGSTIPNLHEPVNRKARTQVRYVASEKRYCTIKRKTVYVTLSFQNGRHCITIGAKVNDSLHPDFVPSLFLPGQSQDVNPQSSCERYERARKRLARTGQDTPTVRKLEAASSDAGTGKTTDTGDPIIPKLEEEIRNLRRERNLYTCKSPESNPFASSSLEGDDKKCMMLTGLKWQIFTTLYNYLHDPCKPCTKKCRMSQSDQLLLTLMKLRCNISFQLLAHMMGVSKTTAIDTFWKWINVQ